MDSDGLVGAAAGLLGLALLVNVAGNVLNKTGSLVQKVKKKKKSSEPNFW